MGHPGLKQLKAHVPSTPRPFGDPERHVFEEASTKHKLPGLGFTIRRLAMRILMLEAGEMETWVMQWQSISKAVTLETLESRPYASCTCQSQERTLLAIT